jgi:hypothetical protein
MAKVALNPLADVKGMSRDENKLGQLGILVRKSLGLESAIDHLETELKKRREELREITERELPTMMAELQMTEFVSQDRKVKIEDIVQGSLPKEPDKRERAIAFMHENGGEDILRATIQIEFPKGDLESAESLARRIRKATNQDVVVDLTAHHSSYAAWARELIRKGGKLPVDDLNLYQARRAVVKPVKPKRR